jgi:endonuclease YncB( thermonuclease family)
LGETLKIRFCGIDAPEIKQQGGIASRDYLRSLLNQSGNQVMIRPIEIDRYGRTVAELYRVAGDQLRVVNTEMTQSGQAYYYARYAANCPNNGLIARAEQAAKQQRLGVWAKPGAVPPWEWRRAKR